MDHHHTHNEDLHDQGFPKHGKSWLLSMLHVHMIKCVQLKSYTNLFVLN